MKDRAKAAACEAAAAAIIACTAVDIAVGRAVRDAQALLRKKKDEKSRKQKDIENAARATKAAAKAAKVAMSATVAAQCMCKVAVAEAEKAKKKAETKTAKRPKTAMEQLHFGPDSSMLHSIGGHNEGHNPNSRMIFVL